MFTLKISDKNLEFKTNDNVFYPTNTTELLVEASRKIIKKPGKTLDLGCGIGIIGITLAKLGLADAPVFASDLSQEAVCLTEENARIHGCCLQARQGALFEPWKGEKFDMIVNDVPGISEDVAPYSRWFPKSVPCASGADGTELAARVIKEAPEHLNPGGIFIFPILSLSDTDKLFLIAKNHFKRVDRVLKRMWSLPDEMRPHLDSLKKMHQDKKIRIEEKFGMVLWYTEVYAATNQ